MYPINGNLTKTHAPLSDRQRKFLLHVYGCKGFVINEHEAERIRYTLKVGEYSTGTQCMFNDLRERYIKEKKLNE